MKNVHHLEINAQPALVDGKTAGRQDGNQPALVSEDRPAVRFHPELTGIVELLAMGAVFPGGLNRVYA